MKLKLMAMAALTSIGIASAALASAGDGTITGTIKSVNPGRNTVTLASGQTFGMPEKHQAEGYMPGDKLVLHWYQQGTAKKVDFAQIVES